MLPQNPSLNLRIVENIISHSKKVAGKMQPILNKINTLGKRSSLTIYNNLDALQKDVIEMLSFTSNTFYAFCTHLIVAL